MESIFEKVFYILTELGMMQDFINLLKMFINSLDVIIMIVKLNT